MSKRISHEDWARMKPRLRSFSHNTTDIGYAVLVEGQKQVDVAKQYGLTTQAVFSNIKRIRKVYDEITKDGVALVYVEGYLPPELAKKVQDMIAQHGKTVE
ncbi:ArdK family transcriptional regulator [Cronobacter sakazakii]|nr:ArdK family transcriptional regulator [Cronobacter sakazakii]